MKTSCRKAFAVVAFALACLCACGSRARAQYYPSSGSNGTFAGELTVGGSASIAGTLSVGSGTKIDGSTVSAPVGTFSTLTAGAVAIPGFWNFVSSQSIAGKNTLVFSGLTSSTSYRFDYSVHAATFTAYQQGLELIFNTDPALTLSGLYQTAGSDSLPNVPSNYCGIYSSVIVLQSCGGSGAGAWLSTFSALSGTVYLNPIPGEINKTQYVYSASGQVAYTGMTGTNTYVTASGTWFGSPLSSVTFTNGYTTGLEGYYYAGSVSMYEMGSPASGPPPSLSMTVDSSLQGNGSAGSPLGVNTAKVVVMDGSSDASIPGGLSVGGSLTSDSERVLAQKYYSANPSTGIVSWLGNANDGDLNVIEEGPGALSQIVSRAYGAGIGATGAINAFAAEGSTGTPSATLLGDGGFFGTKGYNGASETGSKAAITMSATENWTATANGMNLVIKATKAGTTTARPIATFDENGLTMANNATSVGNITTQGNVQASSVSISGSLDVSGYMAPPSLTTTQVRASTPAKGGVIIYNLTLTDVCVSTGTTVEGYRRVSTGGGCE